MHLTKSEYIHFREIDSTQDEAKRRIDSQEISHGTIISADSQTKAHGRYGRKWISEEGSLSMTICLKVNPADVNRISELSYLTAVVIGDVLNELSPRLNFLYKWVNDIYIGEKKLAGILLEMQKDWLLIGIGMNVQQVENREDAAKAISLAENDVFIDNETLCHKITNAFVPRYENWLTHGFYSIREEWLRHAIALKQTITIRFAKNEIKGIFLGIDEKGRLELMQNGAVKLINAGEMYMISNTKFRIKLDK
jgi:BirA family biotin operon repressor/biotin-[acetyl-CoA-carboxylase] ligase